MSSLQKYCINELIIDGLKTYIISREYYENMMHDKKLLEELGMNNEIWENAISFMITATEHISKIKLHFAIVCHENRMINIWEAVNVLEHDNLFYHVAVKYTWICRECQNIYRGNIIMPMVEADPIFLEKKYLHNFVVPDFFNKISCEKCGNLLQNHFYAPAII